MRILFLKDTSITENELASLMQQFSAIYKEYADIEPHYRFEEVDYTTYPTVTDPDGDKKLPHTYMRDVTATAFRKYAEDIDHVVVLIHQDNWKLDGIWGVNYSNIFNGYQLHVCRYARRQANALGTLHHEVMHCFDAFIEKYGGPRIEALIPVNDWDAGVVHGGEKPWVYIRYNENGEALRLIKTPLKAAYAKRRELYRERTLKPLLTQVLALQTQVVALLLQLITPKRAHANEKVNSCRFE